MIGYPSTLTARQDEKGVKPPVKAVSIKEIQDLITQGYNDLLDINMAEVMTSELSARKNEIQNEITLLENLLREEKAKQ
jgi:S-adenosylmethionine:tRNA-ribosyltransferase-isomerase (queuine synthetase)